MDMIACCSSEKREQARQGSSKTQQPGLACMQWQEGRPGLTLGLSLIGGQGSHEAGEVLIHGIQADVVVPITGP